jgi:hypothetical protein
MFSDDATGDGHRAGRRLVLKPNQEIRRGAGEPWLVLHT